MTWDRREFLQRSILALGGFVTGLQLAQRGRSWHPSLLGALLSPAEAGTPADLVWAEGKDPYQNTVAAIKALGGMSRFVSKGARVALLPNIGWARKPECAATTNPAVVKALIKLSKDAGAKSVTVFCNPCNDMRVCLDLSGIGAVIDDAGARFEQLASNGWNKRQAVKGCSHLTSTEVYRLVDESDVLINCPVAKHHGGSVLTMCCKNLMGAVKDRGTLHQSLHEGIADLTQMLPHKLCVLDATRILLRNGPSGGDTKDVKVCNTLIAGLNPVQVDCLGTGLFGKIPSDIKYLQLLGQRGYAGIDTAKYKVARVTA
jgi:uncharacterized protein (DUF362 family)